MDSEIIFKKAVAEARASGSLRFSPRWGVNHFDELIISLLNGELENLHTLDFGECLQLSEDSVTRLAEAAEKGKLQNLQTLNFCGCEQLSEDSVTRLAEAAEKGKLPNLQTLNFRWCSQLADDSVTRLAEAAEKGKLENLQTLYFSWCSQLADDSVTRLAEAAEKGKLESLHSIDFSCCDQLSADSVTRLAEVAEKGKLQNLQTLDFNECRQLSEDSVTRLAVAAEKGKLQNLQTLNFRWCSQLSEDSVIRLAEAAEKGKLQNLQTLDFTDCELLSEDSVTRLAEAVEKGKLENLQTLDFNECRQLSADSVTRLAEAAENGRLENLHTLGFRGCRCPNIALEKLAHAKLELGYLSGLERLEISSDGNDLDSTLVETADAEMILRAFVDQEVLAFAKAIVLGTKQRGKSFFFKRVVKDEVPTRENTPETHGFEVKTLAWKQGGESGKMPNLYVWDFAGEQYLHGLHQVFLERTDLAILVLNATHCAGAGDKLNGNHVGYWTRFLAHCLPDRHSTLVVRTQCDANHTSLSAEQIDVASFGGNCHLLDNFSAVKPDQHTSVEKVHATMAKCLENHRAPITIKGTNRLVKLIREKMEGKAIAPIESYLEWCSEAGFDGRDDPHFMLQYLHAMGELLYFHPSRKDRKRLFANAGRYEPSQTLRFVDRMLKAASGQEQFEELGRWVISPSWLNRPLYAVLHEAQRLSVENHDVSQSGFIDVSVLNTLIRDKTGDLLAQGDHDEQIRVLRKVIELTRFAIKKVVNHVDGYFFPMMQKIDRSNLSVDQKPNAFVEWNFLDLSGFHQLIVQNFDKLMNDRNGQPRFWDLGMAIELSGKEVVVTAAPQEHRLDFFFSDEWNKEAAEFALEMLLGEIMQTLGKPLNQPTLTGVEGILPANGASQENTESSEQVEPHPLQDFPLTQEFSEDHHWKLGGDVAELLGKAPQNFRDSRVNSGTQVAEDSANEAKYSVHHNCCLYRKSGKNHPRYHWPTMMAGWKTLQDKKFFKETTREGFDLEEMPWELLRDFWKEFCKQNGKEPTN